MLEKVDLGARMSGRQFKAADKEMGGRLMALQQKVRALNIPVVVLIEGWSAAGKGSLIAQLIQSLDPRGFKVHAMEASAEEDRRYPAMRRYWTCTPARGSMSILDGSWWSEWIEAQLQDDVDWKAIKSRRAEIGQFESQLLDDGCAVVKLFLHISKKEQKKRFEALEDKKATRWRVTKADWAQNERYAAYLSAYDSMLEHNPDERAPWIIIPGHDRELAAHRMMETVLAQLEDAITQRRAGPNAHWAERPAASPAAIRPVEPLRDIHLDRHLGHAEYKSALKMEQQRLAALHNRLYLRRIPLVLAFEGWDAAGKGGAIRKISSALDPRGYEVVPISAPTPLERAHHYLWRFWQALPKDGHIAIFDRTWYGRVLVERIEGLATEAEWKRAYDEINDFERNLTAHGAILLKFWLHIDPEEQFRRFNARMDNPAKRWKITDEDWRNRDKWPEYEAAIDEMLSRTNTVTAPWLVVEGNDKRYARIKLMHAIADAMEDRLDE